MAWVSYTQPGLCEWIVVYLCQEEQEYEEQSLVPRFVSVSKFPCEFWEKLNLFNYLVQNLNL